MRLLFVLLLVGMTPATLVMATEEPPPHLFDDINGNGISDSQEGGSSGQPVDGGAEITDPGDGDGYIESD